MERVTIAPGLSGVFYPAKEVAPSACLLVLHGFGDHARYCETVSEHVLSDARVLSASRGICCVAPDFPGHGESAGTRGHVETWAEYEQAVDASLAYALERAPRVVVYGNSMGGLLALELFQRRRAGVVGVVVSAPMLALPVPWALETLVISPLAWLMPSQSITINKDAEAPCHGLCTLGWLSHASSAATRLFASAATPAEQQLGGAPPLLVLCGTRDRIVKLTDCERLLAALGQNHDRLRIYKNSGHEPFLGNDKNKPRYLDDVAVFANECLSVASPSSTAGRP